MHDSHRMTAPIAALQVTLCAIWGLGQIATKIGLEGISPLLQAGLRSTGAAVLVVGWAAFRRLPLVPRDGTLGLGVAIGALFALEFVCLYIGLQYTSAARATVLLYTAPFFVAIGTHLFVPGDRLSRQKVAGLALAFVGVLLAFADRVSVPGPRALLGDALCVGGAFFWAATTVLVKGSRLRTLSPERNLLYQLVVSAIVLLAASSIAGEAGVHDATPRVWLALAYQVAIVASTSYVLWFWLIRHYKATTLSAFTFLTPVFGVLFAWLTLGEPISFALVCALLLIAIGIVLVNRG